MPLRGRAGLKRTDCHIPIVTIIDEKNSVGHDLSETEIHEKKRENSSDYTKLLSSIRIVYDCGDMGTALGICEELSLKQGLDTELTLKLLKWMFIAEDVNYPHSWSMGREMLMKKIDEI